MKLRKLFAPLFAALVLTLAFATFSPNTVIAQKTDTPCTSPNNKTVSGYIWRDLNSSRITLTARIHQNNTILATDTIYWWQDNYYVDLASTNVLPCTLVTVTLNTSAGNEYVVYPYEGNVAGGNQQTMLGWDYDPNEGDYFMSQQNAVNYRVFKTNYY
ncbi:MAG TPA: hypothetical protein VF644_10420 [Pyrinomonadaceae bacterium]